MAMKLVSACLLLVNDMLVLVSFYSWIKINVFARKNAAENKEID